MFTRLGFHGLGIRMVRAPQSQGRREAEMNYQAAPITNLISRNGYLSLRRKYEPVSPAMIIVAESPPASGRYFYDPNGAITEPLFAALMKQLNVSAECKEAGLREFRRRRWVLVDATYQPVNTLRGAMRDEVIQRDYPLLREDLRDLTGNAPAPLLLLKANVCRILEPMLIADEFNVINQGGIVYFPSNGQQNPNISMRPAHAGEGVGG